MNLHQIKTIPSRKKNKRFGRGYSSGRGKTSGRGANGQKSRSGFNIPKRFEGGQSSLIQKLPKKRGFKVKNKNMVIINLTQLDKNYTSGETVSPKTLQDKKIIRSAKIPIKILANGQITKKLFIKGCLMSKKTKDIFNNQTSKE